MLVDGVLIWSLPVSAVTPVSLSFSLSPSYIHFSTGWTVYHQTSERITYKSSSKPRTRFLSGPVSMSICLYLFYFSSITHNSPSPVSFCSSFMICFGFSVLHFCHVHIQYSSTHSFSDHQAFSAITCPSSCQMALSMNTVQNRVWNLKKQQIFSERRCVTHVMHYALCITFSKMVVVNLMRSK